MGPCVRTSACTHLLESSQGLGATTQRNDSFSPGRTREMRSSSRNQVFDLESDFRLEKMCACPSAFAGTTERSAWGRQGDLSAVARTAFDGDSNSSHHALAVVGSAFERCRLRITESSNS